MKVVPYHPGSSHQHNEALREVEMLRLLKHPNIVQFKEAYIASSGEELYVMIAWCLPLVPCQHNPRIPPSWLHSCIVMTYCENGDLTAWIKTGKQKGKLLPEKQVSAVPCTRAVYSSGSSLVVAPCPLPFSPYCYAYSSPPPSQSRALLLTHCHRSWRGLFKLPWPLRTFTATRFYTETSNRTTFSCRGRGAL